MKTIQVLFSSFLFALLIFSCNDTVVEGSKNVVKETRKVSNFSKVQVGDAIKVQITRGSKAKVEVRANENLINKIATEVTNGTLYVKYRGSVSTKNAVSEVTIQMPTIEHITLNDAVNAEVRDFTGLSKLEVDVNDASNLSISGDADILDINVADAGNVRGFSFVANNCNVQVGDASQLSISCNKLLEGKVTDASVLRYKGNPTVTAKATMASKMMNAN